MSSRVAFKAALLALAFMLVILGISAYSLSVDRNEELTESLAFGCVVASELLEGAEDDAQRVAILDTLPEDAKMGLAYFSKDGVSLYDNRPGREHMTAQETERIRQMVKRYRKTRSRDFFKASEAKEIETGINEIIDGVKGIASDLGKQLRKMMDV